MAGIDTFFQVINLGILVGIAYSLKRMFLLEKRIKDMDSKLFAYLKKKRK